MALIKEEEINNIRNQANIVDIISSYMPLTKSGNDYVGVCPFHDDHSPSMHVSTKLNIFKCFVCNAGGNVFTFVQKFENVSYPEAIKIVANKSGINFNYQTSAYEGKNHLAFEVMALSLKYYQNNLASQSGLEAKKYLMNRGITQELMNEYQFGLSLNQDSLLNFFTKRKTDLKTANEVGLLSNDGINYHDMFIDRIMIPIFDMQGRLAGYTARCYKQDEKPKYINSKETIIYKKSNILFNYYFAKDSARLEKELIIVEGNMDAISLMAQGIKNVCALMGVVISQNQIDAIKKLNCKVILMLDSDNAGELATIKVGEEMQKNNLNIAVVRLSGAKDPDEYIRKYGVDKLRDNIKYAKSFVDYQIEQLKANYDLSSIADLTEYIKQVLKSLQNASDLEKEINIAKISKEYNVDPEIIKKNLNIKKEPVKIIEQPVKKKMSRYDLAVNELLYAMLTNKDYYLIYQNKLGFLRNKIERDTVALIGSYIKKNNDIDIAGFIDYTINYEDVANYLQKILGEKHVENLEENDFYDIVETVSKCIDEEDIKELKIQIKNEQDVAKKLELIERLTEIKKGCGNNEGS